MKITVIDHTPEAELMKINFLSTSLDLEYEKAHQDYEKRKNEMITKLYTIWKNNNIPTVYRNWIRQAARFINEREI